ncbi:MAG: SH3 domain-containing protein [Chroococcidiopsidaceae cyanobacterium CP_BM_RX_35]|nr:SH3 domain-containing protein [Chroococcidiopsidaceae cyanobacterium CP_BM_RX_35]
MFVSALAKLVLGVFLAIAILGCGGVAASLYFINRNSTPPPKPIYANDKPSLVARRLAAKKKAKSQLKPIAEASPADSPSPGPLEPGTYKARVTWSDGLRLRSEPNSDAETIGSLGYNQEVVVLAESDNQKWQRIRIEDSGKEGWVKTGNTERIDKQ